MPAPKADVVKRFREATRMGWMASKHFLKTESPELCERILEAGEKQPGADTLHDPIEDHPDYKEMIEALRETIEKEVREEIAFENEERCCSSFGFFKSTSLAIRSPDNPISSDEVRLMLFRSFSPSPLGFVGMLSSVGAGASI